MIYLFIYIYPCCATWTLTFTIVAYTRGDDQVTLTSSDGALFVVTDVAARRAARVAALSVELAPWASLTNAALQARGA